MKLLLDEMYGEKLAGSLRAAGIDATTALGLRLAGAPDLEVFATAVATECTLLTENVGDFTRIVGEHIASGRHHSGLLIALSSRFSRRPAGVKPLVAAIQAIADERLDDRVIYLRSGA